MLGHDEPKDFFDERELYWLDQLWFHAKTPETLRRLLYIREINAFYHDKDMCTLTSMGYIWNYIGSKFTEKSIIVLPEKTPGIYTSNDFNNCLGICSDYIEEYKKYKYKEC